MTGNTVDRGGSLDRVALPDSVGCGHLVVESRRDADAWEYQQIGSDCDTSDGSSKILRESENDQGTPSDGFGVFLLRGVAHPSWRSLVPDESSFKPLIVRIAL